MSSRWYIHHQSIWITTNLSCSICYQAGSTPILVDTSNTSWMCMDYKRGKISLTRSDIDSEPPTPKIVAWETCSKPHTSQK